MPPRHLLLLATVAAAGAPAFAATPAPGADPEHGVETERARPITFDAALGLTGSTPRVVGTAKAVSEKAALNRKISALTYNPQITVVPGWRFAPPTGREPELVVEVLQPWNVSGQGQARRETAGLEESAVAAEARATALTSRLAAARAWIGLWGAERVLDETRREEAIAAELERLVTRATALGAMTRADLAEARAYHAEARLAVLNAEGEWWHSGLGLAREIAAPASVPLRADGPLPQAPAPASTRRDAYLERMSALPAVALRVFQARAAGARAVEEHAARGTVAQLGATLQRDAPGGLVVSAVARLIFPLFDRGERERGTMRADAARLSGEGDDALVAARADLAASFHDVDHTAALLSVLQDDLAPASREAAETRRRIFQNGGATLLEVLQSERTAVAAASRLRRMQAEHAWARAKLWLLATAIALSDPNRGPP